MAVFTYGANDISIGTFNTWANNVSAQANTSLSSSLSDFDPANAAPFQVSEIAPNSAIFYGQVIAGTGGGVALSAPYTVANTTSFTVKNILIDDYSLSLVATAVYPYTFDSWRDAADGGGSQLSTNATLSLTETDHTGVTVFYAHFSSTHTDPTDSGG